MDNEGHKKIKPLDDETLRYAVDLKIRAWTEELAGKLLNTLEFDTEYAYWLQWMHMASLDGDQRVLLGLFDEHILCGAIFASLAAAMDHPSALEINGFWIEKKYRNQKASYQLIQQVLADYAHMKMQAVIIYSHRYAPSNRYYHHLGGVILRTDDQMDGQLLVDVFLFDYVKLDDLINVRLKGTKKDE